MRKAPLCCQSLPMAELLSSAVCLSNSLPSNGQSRTKWPHERRKKEEGGALGGYHQLLKPREIGEWVQTIPRP